MIMLHGIFRIPHVDGVDWTLEVELLFYCGMLSLFRLNALHRVSWVLIVLLSIRIVYWAAARFAGVDLPWTIYRLLILQCLPWFAIGISIFVLVSRTHGDRGPAFLTASLAVLTLLIADGAILAALAVAIGCVIWGAASGEMP